MRIKSKHLFQVKQLQETYELSNTKTNETTVYIQSQGVITVNLL